MAPHCTGHSAQAWHQLVAAGGDAALCRLRRGAVPCTGPARRRRLLARPRAWQRILIAPVSQSRQAQVRECPMIDETDTIDQRRLIIPGLGGLYRAMAPLGYAAVRVLTALVLFPGGIDKLI